MVSPGWQTFELTDHAPSNCDAKRPLQLVEPTMSESSVRGAVGVCSRYGGIVQGAGHNTAMPYATFQSSAVNTLALQRSRSAKSHIAATMLAIISAIIPGQSLAFKAMPMKYTPAIAPIRKPATPSVTFVQLEGKSLNQL